MGHNFLWSHQNYITFFPPTPNLKLNNPNDITPVHWRLRKSRSAGKDNLTEKKLITKPEARLLQAERVLKISQLLTHVAEVM